MGNRWGNNGNSERLYILGFQKSLQMVTVATKLKDDCFWKKRYEQLRQHIKNRDIFFVEKGLYRKSYGFSSSHVWMWELDHIEGWVPKNWCFWTVVFKKMLQSPLDCKDIKPLNLKGNQPWIFIRRTNAETETPILWAPDAKSWPIRKGPDAGKDWRQEEKETTEDEMVRWHNWLDGHECEQALGDGEGQKSLAYYSPRGCKKSVTTERLNKATKNECKDKSKI